VAYFFCYQLNLKTEVGTGLHVSLPFHNSFFCPTVSTFPTMPENKPALVLIPGMSSVASLVYEPLIAQLKNRGIEQIQPIHLPSIDAIATKASLKPTPLDADVSAIRSALVELVEHQGREVVVVSHSYGGTPALCACTGLWKDERDGKHGGVIRACLISSSLSLPGQSVGGVRAAWAQEHPEAGINDSGAKMESVGEV
jgi:alpha-beta hydrolase superfamily lysophospholipase